MIGTTLGPYRVVAAIGAGGMGEVFRARDAKLNRDVALKMLPPAFALDPDRLARFRREAQVLAALTHPNIARIYGFEDSGDTHALVLEFVDGPTLAERIARGPLPAAEALPIARQIALALEYAHEHGIVHRDLKPANVKAAADGTVTILDFGIAAALQTGTAAEQAEATTISVPLTEAGLALGTPSYMSPEQAAGKPGDRRMDVWAFGCVFFEMLTGTRAFLGENVPDTLALVMRGEPDWSRLPATTSTDIRTLLGRCLRKDASKRLQAIGDARIVLEDVLAGAPADASAPTTPSRPRSRSLEMIGAAIFATLIGLAAWSLKPVPVSPQPVRSFTVALEPGMHLPSADRGVLALSNDGRLLAYVATAANGGQQVYVHAMDTDVTTLVAGTDGASMPFFSPDNDWLGFFAGGRLKKVPLKGGASVTLTDVPNALGATWSARHTIVFATLWSVLQQAPDAAGGAPQALTEFAATENTHTSPQAIPGTSALLFTSAGPGSRTVAVGDISGGPHQDLVAGRGIVAPSYVAPGYLVYLQNNNLMAVPVDLARRRVEGDAVLAVPHVRQYAVSATGSLAYVAGSPPDTRSQLTWVSRAGVAQTVDERADNYYQPRLDPVRGDRIVMDLSSQVWSFDLATHNLTPFTFGDLNQHAIWTRDGRELVFMVQKGRTWQLVRQAADGSGKPEAITNDPGLLDIPYSLTPDGSLAFVKYSGTAESQLWTLPVHGPAGAALRAERVFSIPIADAEAGPAFSPDGKWLAYAASDAAGRRQIYVQAYPGPGDKHQVSIDGGNEPLWNPDPKKQPLELFYRNGDDMMATEITTRPDFRQGKRQRLFAGAAGYKTAVASYVRPNYDVSPDGQRFLMLKPVGREDAPVSDIHVVLNWSEDLKRLAPAKK